MYVEVYSLNNTFVYAFVMLQHSSELDVKKAHYNTRSSLIKHYIITNDPKKRRGSPEYLGFWERMKHLRLLPYLRHPCRVQKHVEVSTYAS